MGVLAIIGVLSIVGIQGYKTAMLRHKANLAWEALNQFRVAVEEYLIAHPGDKNKTISSSSGTNNPSNNTIYLNRVDLIPDFADNSIYKFNMYAVYGGAKPYIMVANISVDGLCTTMLPTGTSTVSDTSVTKNNRVYLDVENNTFRWYCQVQTKDNAPLYTP